jgi:RhtB (resistance to homoserine/threonine) family protein
MLMQFFTVGLLMLLAVMLPGPDFALVLKNSVLHSRKAGIFTSIGISCAVLVHMSYCILGLALVISQSLLLFSCIKYIGATYLIYLGITSLMSTHQTTQTTTPEKLLTRTPLRSFTAFRQGFLCNLLNPKATLFFLALFTVIIKPSTPKLWEMLLAIEMFMIICLWFCSLTLILSHPRILRLLTQAERYLAKIVGVFLCGFGIALVFLKR